MHNSNPRTMKRVRLFHWKDAEAEPVVELLGKAGYEVEFPGAKANGKWASIRADPPHAAVIDLTRMPSHGRYVGLALRQNKSLRHIPLVFLDGDPAKVDRIRGELPDAVFTTRAKLAAALKKVKPAANPTIPSVSIMTPDPNRTTAQKLGIKAKMRVAVVDPPRDYAKVVGPLPGAAALEEDPQEDLPLTLWFVSDAESYLAALPRIRQRAAKTRIWVVYPKTAKPKAGKSGAGKSKAARKARVMSTAVEGGQLTQFSIREAALELGLVDYKICSLDDRWTGMLVTIKKG